METSAMPRSPKRLAAALRIWSLGSTPLSAFSRLRGRPTRRFSWGMEAELMESRKLAGCSALTVYSQGMPEPLKTMSELERFRTQLAAGQKNFPRIQLASADL